MGRDPGFHPPVLGKCRPELVVPKPQSKLCPHSGASEESAPLGQTPEWVMFLELEVRFFFFTINNIFVIFFIFLIHPPTKL